MSVTELAARVRAGDLRAVARAISLVEDEHRAASALLGRLHGDAGQAYVVGVTGAPAAGKSTLVDRLVTHLRAAGQRVGVLAVDPSSPYSGGALLGDRVRMQRHALDAGVFIRSMATRGHLGGLSRATADAALVLDAAGFDVVIIETVGVGQDEIDVVRTADVSIVVVVPGAGDDVQALKAGIMEIADIFVVNKADREGADHAVASIAAMLALQTDTAVAWRPPILRTEAIAGTGVAELWEHVDVFRRHPASRRDARRRARVAFRLRDLLGQRFLRHVQDVVLPGATFDSLVEAVAARAVDPYTAADGVLREALTAAPPAGTWEVPAPGPTLPTLDHVGIAVHDVDPVLQLFCAHLGLAATADELVASQGVRVRFVEASSARIEVIEPLSADSAVGRFLDKRGPGLHHVALAVDRLDDLLRTLDARGVRLIDHVPRPGAGGSRIAFIHPSATGGVLVELKERK